MAKTLKILIPAALALLAASAFFLLLRHPGTTLAQSVNAGIDNLAATAIRLSELPMFMLLFAASLVAALLALPLLAWGTRSGKITAARLAACVLGSLVLVSLALAADRHISRLQTQIAVLRTQLARQRLPANPPDPTAPTLFPILTPTPTPPETPAPTPPAAPSNRTAFLLDFPHIQQDFSVLFGPATFHPIIHDESADIVEVDMQNPQVISYLAVVNLRTPGLQIQYGGSLTEKSLTSDFAKTNHCQIAINGEAGASPMLNSGLGEWHGNMISAGQVLLQENPTNKRPFLAFDRQNNASFTALAATDRAIGEGKFNVIWGRTDAVIDSRVQSANERDRQPRTAMAINKDGTRLYLLVVDGRQQQYSLGFTRQEAGLFLQTFGAANGMLCDEGGSSCMWLKKFNGVVNSPSDGVERPTYTHFGIALNAN